jgi:hypothetical protein
VQQVVEIKLLIRSMDIDAGVVFSDVWPWGSPTTTVNFEASCAQYLMESCMTGLSGDCFEASIDRDVVVFDPYGSWRTPRDYVVLYPVT